MIILHKTCGMYSHVDTKVLEESVASTFQLPDGGIKVALDCY